ncbi:hypothetical protein WN55_02420 [Dufourea novaeangliae]|uniref:Uncharacterized protein n=1 Tax=Dufourea novaeangliae TaxID=178035 RepID=A0A154PGS8_DUFNO|nr:hypothetical protein WN55_02420 [Dufourea novaeangliae]
MSISKGLEVLQSPSLSAGFLKFVILKKKSKQTDVVHMIVLAPNNLSNKVKKFVGFIADHSVV